METGIQFIILLGANPDYRQWNQFRLEMSSKDRQKVSPSSKESPQPRPPRHPLTSYGFSWMTISLKKALAPKKADIRLFGDQSREIAVYSQMWELILSSDKAYLKDIIRFGDRTGIS